MAKNWECQWANWQFSPVQPALDAISYWNYTIVCTYVLHISNFGEKITTHKLHAQIIVRYLSMIT